MRQHDRLVAFAVRFRAGLAGDQDTLTLVEAAADGWWYSARLPDGERMVVFHCDAGSAVARMARSPSGYAALLKQTEHIRWRLDHWQYTAVVGPLVLAAGSTQLNLVQGHGWIAAGDAAQAFDPLASRGIVSALYSGMQAAQALIAVRQGDQQACEQYTEQFHALYTSYLRSKSAYYALEQRWADRDFWAIRSR
jgi:flavin-dependent dehydrogenase